MASDNTATHEHTQEHAHKDALRRSKHEDIALAFAAEIAAQTTMQQQHEASATSAATEDAMYTDDIGEKRTPTKNHVLLAELASDLTQNISPTFLSYLFTRTTAVGSEPSLLQSGGMFAAYVVCVHHFPIFLCELHQRPCCC